MDKHEKKIHFKIDKNEYKIEEDQNPVTGAYLRSLPPVPEDYDLWLRGKGHDEDVLIAPEAKVKVADGDHFFTIKKENTNGGDLR